MVKNLPAMWETGVLSLGWEDPLEKGKATHNSSLAWSIPWTIFHGVTKSRTWLSDQNTHILRQRKIVAWILDYGDFQGKIDTKFHVIVYHIKIMVTFPNHMIFISPITIVLAWNFKCLFWIHGALVTKFNKIISCTSKPYNFFNSLLY